MGSGRLSNDPFRWSICSIYFILFDIFQRINQKLSKSWIRFTTICLWTLIRLPCLNFNRFIIIGFFYILSTIFSFTGLLHLLIFIGLEYMSQLFHIIRWTITLFSSLTVSYRLICCFRFAFIALTSNRELVACIGTHSFIDFSLELKTLSYQTWRAIFRGNFRIFGTDFLWSYFFSNLHNILLMIFELFF